MSQPCLRLPLGGRGPGCRPSVWMLVRGSLVRRVHVAVRAVLPPVVVAVKQTILVMQVRVLVLVQVLVRMHVSMRMGMPHHAVAMLVLVLVAMLV